MVRKNTEAILIKKSQEPMNLDSGLLLPTVWNPILLNTPSLPHPPHNDITLSECSTPRGNGILCVFTSVHDSVVMENIKDEE